MRRFSEADLPDLEGKTALVTGANTGSDLKRRVCSQRKGRGSSLRAGIKRRALLRLNESINGLPSLALHLSRST